jgi:hypothetical protein
MASYTFPALGFDPAPGDPDAVEAVARDCLRSAQDLGADADLLKLLTGHIDWQGEAADAFTAHPAQLHDDLARASEAYGGTGSALTVYAADLRQAKLEARRLEEEAGEARTRADRHGVEVDHISQTHCRRTAGSQHCRPDGPAGGGASAPGHRQGRLPNGGDGFVPAPGDPDTIEAAARDCVRSAQDLGADADLCKRLTEHIDWQGEAADASCWGGADVFDARGE